MLWWEFNTQAFLLQSECKRSVPLFEKEGVGEIFK